MKPAGALKEFAKYLEFECGKSAKTVENYSRGVSAFFSCSKIKKLELINIDQVEDFKDWLASRKGATYLGSETMAVKTQNYYLIALRSFLKFLQTRCTRTIDPALVHLQKSELDVPVMLPAQELSRILEQHDCGTPLDLRNKLIILILMTTGMKVSELCKLDIEDLAVTQGSCTVRSKNGNARIAVLSKETKMLLKKYLKKRTDTSPSLFIQYGKNAKGTTDLRLSPKTIQRVVKETAIQSGVTQNVTPKSLRHSYAFALVESGVEPEQLREKLGHKSILSTKIYTAISDKQYTE